MGPASDALVVVVVIVIVVVVAPVAPPAVRPEPKPEQPHEEGSRQDHHQHHRPAPLLPQDAAVLPVIASRAHTQAVRALPRWGAVPAARGFGPAWTGLTRAHARIEEVPKRTSLAKALRRIPFFAGAVARSRQPVVAAAVATIPTLAFAVPAIKAGGAGLALRVVVPPFVAAAAGLLLRRITHAREAVLVHTRRLFKV